MVLNIHAKQLLENGFMNADFLMAPKNIIYFVEKDRISPYLLHTLQKGKVKKVLQLRIDFSYHLLHN